MIKNGLFYHPNGESLKGFIRSLKDNLVPSNTEIEAKLMAHLDWCRQEVPMYASLPEGGDPFSRLSTVMPFDKAKFAYPTDYTRSRTRFSGERVDGTSGTSGLSFRFITTRNERAVRKAYEILGNDLLGLSAGAKHIVLWGGHESHGSLLRTAKVLIMNQLTGRTLRVVSGADKTSLKVAESDIKSNAGGVLVTYPSMLKGLIEDLGLADILRTYKSIILTGEALPPDIFTKYEFYNIKNRYGSREFGAIAVGEGRALGYFSGRFVLELDPALGLLVTDLEKYCMPMLRYPIGDFLANKEHFNSELGTCVGNSRLTSLGWVEGRVFDILIGRSGKKYVGTFWTIFLKEIGLSKFRLIEVGENELVLKYVGDVNESYVNSRLFEKLANDFSFELLKVEDIPELNNAKQKIVERQRV